MGLIAHIVPLFIAEPMAWNVPDVSCYDALFVSSAQSLRLGGEGLAALRSLPCYAVGPATAKAAEDKGFQIRQVGTTNGDQLISEMEAAGIRHILWLCGEPRSPLVANQAQLTPLPCYRMVAAVLDDKERALLSQPAVLLASSKRGAERLAEIVTERREDYFIAAISPKVSQALGSGWGGIAVAERPDDAAMLAVAAKLCHKHGQVGPSKE